jgi:glyoxylase I family protein
VPPFALLELLLAPPVEPPMFGQFAGSCVPLPGVVGVVGLAGVDGVGLGACCWMTAGVSTVELPPWLAAKATPPLTMDASASGAATARMTRLDRLFKLLPPGIKRSTRALSPILMLCDTTERFGVFRYMITVHTEYLSAIRAVYVFSNLLLTQCQVEDPLARAGRRKVALARPWPSRTMDVASGGGRKMVEITGIAHVELTVRDLDASEAWYARAFGLVKAWEGEDAKEGIRARSLFERTSRIVLGLTQHAGARGDAFDAKRPGLDHLSFAVADRGALKDWAAKLAGDGFACSAVEEVGHGASFTVRDPDELAVEMYVRGAPPS